MIRGHVLSSIAVAAVVLVAVVERWAAGAEEGERSAPTSTPRLVVLGTAQDGGYPQVACSCARCALARRNPALARKVASLALHVRASDVTRAAALDTTWLIDATPDLAAQIEAIHAFRSHPEDRTDRRPVDGILLTHAHIGHYLGLAWLGFETLASPGIPVRASPRMAAFLRGNGPWSQLVAQKNIELREIEPGREFELLPGVKIKPIRVPHRDEFSDTLAYVIRGPRRTVLYVPDTEPWRTWERPLPVVLAAERIDLALLDGTFFSRDELPDRDPASIGHPLIADTMDLLEPLVLTGKLEVRFTHLNHSNLALDPAGPARRSIEKRGFRLLEDGEEIDL